MGFFVAEKRQIYSKAERLRRLRLAVDDFIHEAVFLDFSAEEIRKVVDEKLTELDWETKPIGENMIVTALCDHTSPPDLSDSVIELRAHSLLRAKMRSRQHFLPGAGGSVFAFIGRNGAGKTTTIRMLLGLLEPTRAHRRPRLRQRRPPRARAGIGYMAEGHPVCGWMRVGQYGRSQRSFYHHWNQEIFAAVIDYFAINPAPKAGHLAHGQPPGLHLAMTLAIEPDVLMLDDPATGLDPAARRSLLEAMIYFTRSRERHDLLLDAPPG